MTSEQFEQIMQVLKEIKEVLKEDKLKGFLDSIDIYTKFLMNILNRFFSFFEKMGTNCVHWKRLKL